MIQLLPSILLFEKAKKLPEGTVRSWKGHDYKKVNGKWIKQKKGSSKKDKVETSLDKETSDAIMEVYNDIKDMPKLKGVSLNDLAYAVNQELTDPVALKKVRAVLRSSINSKKDSEKNNIKFKNPKNVDSAYNSVYDMVIKDFKGDKDAYGDIEEIVQDRFEKKYGVTYDDAMDEAATYKDKKRLKKSIPTVPNNNQPIENYSEPKKVIPQEVKNFIKKIEESFKTIDASVADLCKQCGVEKCADVLASYKKFKSDYEYQINVAINYPKSSKDANEVVEVDKRNDYDSSRVRLSKLTI